MAKGSRSNLDSLKTTERRGAGQARNVDGVPNPGGVETRLSDILGADDLKAIEALASTGLLARIAANSWALRSLALSAGAEAIASWTNPAGVAGNPELGLDVQDANEVLAGPASGSPAVPAFRALVAGDLPFAYEVSTWTPTITFATPGTLSVAYSTQSGTHIRIGGLIIVACTLIFTPTLGTASGEFRIAGLPFTVGPNSFGPLVCFSSVTYPVGATQCKVQFLGGTTTARVIAEGSAVAIAAWGTTQIPTGTARNIQFAGYYFL